MLQPKSLSQIHRLKSLKSDLAELYPLFKRIWTWKCQALVPRYSDYFCVPTRSCGLGEAWVMGPATLPPLPLPLPLFAQETRIGSYVGMVQSSLFSLFWAPSDIYYLFFGTLIFLLWVIDHFYWELTSFFCLHRESKDTKKLCKKLKVSPQPVMLKHYK